MGQFVSTESLTSIPACEPLANTASFRRSERSFQPEPIPGEHS
jgi:hypothetical protein